MARGLLARTPARALEHRVQKASRRLVLFGAGLIAALGLGLWLQPRAAPPPGRPAAVAPTPAPPSPVPATAPATAAPGPELHRAERRLMGTVWAITIAGGDPERAQIAMNAALDAVEKLEGIMSEWRPDSEISAVNRAAGVAKVKVGPDLMTCLKVSLQIARWSDGAFDVSWAALRDLWDFGPDSRHVPPSRQQVQARLPLWNWRNIRIDEKQSSVFLARKGMQLGLGGVAKGYAADKAGDILLEAGFENFLVFAGGQVLVHGKRGDRPWRVGIQHPRASSYFGFVEVAGGSVATSGDYEHSFMYEGRRYHHIIDPATGFPSDKTASVTLISPTALWADAVDTAVFILGHERGLAALAHAPGGPHEAVIVDPEMRLWTTPGIRSRLMLRAHVGDDQRIGEPLPADQPAEILSDVHHEVHR
jgi:thiamine biosynthesis lipoprotein